jgi:hypothetical protein
MPSAGLLPAPQPIAPRQEIIQREVEAKGFLTANPRRPADSLRSWRYLSCSGARPFAMIATIKSLERAALALFLVSVVTTGTVLACLIKARQDSEQGEHALVALANDLTRARRPRQPPSG